jgi:anti-sigma regulatory factor (Ser/Thr protein kinase)
MVPAEMNASVLRARFTVSPDESAGVIAALLDRYHAFAETVQLPVAVKHETHLVLDELVANIIHHALAGRGGSISLVMELSGDYLRVELTDDGPPFDPFAPAMSRTREPDAEGGFGLMLTTRFAEGLTYRNDGRQNRVTFRKRVPYTWLRQLVRTGG